MTVDKIKQKLLELEAQRDQAIAKVNSIQGAIAILEQLIIEEENPKK